MKRKLPDHIQGTIKAWRTRKRTELHSAIKALEIFRRGCAYTPAKDVGKIIKMLEEDKRRLSVKEWK